MHMNSDNTCPFCIYTSDTYEIKTLTHTKKREEKPVIFPEKKNCIALLMPGQYKHCSLVLKIATKSKQ